MSVKDDTHVSKISVKTETYALDTALNTLTHRIGELVNGGPMRHAEMITIKCIVFSQDVELDRVYVCIKDTESCITDDKS